MDNSQTITVGDVSKWQETIDWDEFGKHVDAVVIKATGADGGLYTDNMLARNRDEARRIGKPRWFYHFKGAGVSAADQAAYVLHAIGGLQPGEAIVVDDENEVRVNTGFDAEFTDAIKNLAGGMINVLYSNLGRFQGVDLSSIKSRNVGGWAAKYGVNDGTLAGAGSAPGGIDLSIIMWQYTSAARVPGVSANSVDLSIFYGNINQFTAYGPKGAVAVPSVSQPASAPSPTGGTGIYTVVSGDTLSGIGPKVGMAWQAIAALNGIVAPYWIYPGQQLKVYGGSLGQTVIPTNTYRVVSGDTLIGIGIKTGIDWRNIASWNNLTSPYTIYPGQVLSLGGGMPASAQNVRTYTVRPGDFLIHVGQVTGVDWQRIANINGLRSPYTIYPGQVLKLD